jgi:hypothetical protein
VTLIEAADRLGYALARAVDEHGRPNSFTCDELALMHGGPRATLAGRVAGKSELLARVEAAVGAPVSYDDKRWCVE